MTAPLRTRSFPASSSPPSAVRSRQISTTALRRNARYSRWVGGLKLLLPAAAVVIVSLILAWPRLMIDDKRFGINPTTVTVEDANSLRMLHPRFVGTDEKRRPFTVTADEASQAEPQTRKLLLMRPHADMTMENNAWVTLSALSGVYQSDKRTLLLKERVDVFHDTGAEFHTDEALVDLAAGTVTGVMPVEGQGPAGTVTGQGIQVRDRGAVVVFTGRAKVVLWSRGNS